MQPSVQQPISKDKNVMVQTRKYYLKNHYLTLKSKDKVTGRSLWDVTHRLMVMRPHTKYHWPISKETIIWPWGQRSRSNKGHYGMRHTALWSCTYIPNSIDLSRKTKMLWPGQQILLKKTLFDLDVKGQGPTKVITVRNTPSYGHAPTYQISLTYLERQKMLWPGQENTI